MKKLIAVGVFGAIVVGGVAMAVSKTPERTLCQRTAELCQIEGDLDDLNECEEAVTKIRKRVGEEPVTKAAECVDSAKSCSEASGCIAGAGYSMLPGLMKDFASGFAKGAK